MNTHGLRFGYPLVSRVLGGLLLLAGALKVHQLATASAEVEGGRTLTGVGAGFELLFGVWLLLGLNPRLTRCVALGCFIGFLHVALFKALEGRQSCQCFGNLPIWPWVTVGIDALAVLALFVCPLPAETLSPPQQRTRLRVFGLSCVGLAGAVGAVAVMSWAFEGSASEQAPRGKDHELIRKVVQGINRNDARVESLAFRAERTAENAGVSGTKKEVTQVPGGGKIVVETFGYDSWDYRFLLKGDAFRRERLRGGKVDEEVVFNGRKAMQYLPGDRQAWVRMSPDGEADPIDPRCYGFEPGTGSVTTWLQEATVSDVRRGTGPGEQADILVTLVDKKGKPVEVTFSPARNYLPVAVCVRYDDGSIWTSATLSYQRLPGTDSWFLARGERRFFARGATKDAESMKWLSRTTLTVRGQITINPAINPRDFDPILPAGTIVDDAFLRRTIRVGEGQPVFSIGGNRDSSQRSNNVWRQWPTLLFVDGLLIAACVVCRRRLFASGGKGLDAVLVYDFRWETRTRSGCTLWCSSPSSVRATFKGGAV